MVFPCLSFPSTIGIVLVTYRGQSSRVRDGEGSFRALCSLAPTYTFPGHFLTRQQNVTRDLLSTLGCGHHSTAFLRSSQRKMSERGQIKKNTFNLTSPSSRMSVSVRTQPTSTDFGLISRSLMTDKWCTKHWRINIA